MARFADELAAAGGALFAAAADRNKEALLAMLEPRLPKGCAVLEVASGTGQHAVYLAPRLRVSSWQPTDLEAAHVASCDARAAALASSSKVESVCIQRARPLNVMEWPEWAACSAFDAVLCCNMVHIAPLAATGALLAGASRALRPGGVLYVYGPFLVEGEPTTASNAAFDAKLRGMDPEYGLRDVGALELQAATVGLKLTERIGMPANNLTLVLAKPLA